MGLFDREHSIASTRSEHVNLRFGERPITSALRSGDLIPDSEIPGMLQNVNAADCAAAVRSVLDYHLENYGQYEQVKVHSPRKRHIS